MGNRTHTSTGILDRHARTGDGLRRHRADRRRAGPGGASSTPSAQEAPDCEVIDLGTLTEGDGGLHASGRWTTGDCDSRFRIDSDAHSYRFQLAEG